MNIPEYLERHKGTGAKIPPSRSRVISGEPTQVSSPRPKVTFLFVLAETQNDLFYLKYCLQRLSIVTAKENIAERRAKIVIISQYAKLQYCYCTCVYLENLEGTKCNMVVIAKVENDASQKSLGWFDKTPSNPSDRLKPITPQTPSTPQTHHPAQTHHPPKPTTPWCRQLEQQLFADSSVQTGMPGFWLNQQAR